MIHLFRLACFFTGHQWAAVQWNRWGTPIAYCCLRCFTERGNSHMPPARPPTEPAR